MSDLPGPLEPRGAFDNWMMVNGPYVYSGCLLFFGGGMLIGAIMAIQDGLRAKRVAKTMHTFPSVPGEVIESKVNFTVSKYGVKRFFPYIEYRYEANSKSYKSINVLPGQFTESLDEQWAKNWVDAYPVGRSIEVFYDPKNPKICVVERQGAHVPKDAGGTIWMGLFLGAIGLWVLWMVFTRILPYGGKWPEEIPKPPAEAALDGSYPDPGELTP